VRGQGGGFAQQARGLSALPGHHLLERRPASQRGGQHAARAGSHDEIDVGGRARQPVRQAGQRAGHPGRAKDAARPEYQAGAATTRPIRTEHHSGHRHLRNHSRRRQLTVGCA
jgi:hypothetical protein